MYLHQHSWHSCSRTQQPQGAATTGHGSCHLEAGESRGGGEGGRGEGGKGRGRERRKVGEERGKGNTRISVSNRTFTTGF